MRKGLFGTFFTVTASHAPRIAAMCNLATCVVGETLLTFVL